MKASELMIGNWVNMYVNGYRVECKVREISKNGIRSWESFKEYKDELNKSSVAEFKPIPLTEEWLLKFGFVGLDGWSKHTIELCDVTLLCIDKDLTEEAYSCVSILDTIDGVPVYLNSVWLEYVHQLQNLYFALTGEELKIEL